MMIVLDDDDANICNLSVLECLQRSGGLSAPSSQVETRTMEKSGNGLESIFFLNYL